MLATTLDGFPISDTVTLLSIAKPKAVAPFISLTANNMTLMLTAEHHLPVGSPCCKTVKKAKDVVEGEIIWTSGAQGTINSAVVTKKGLDTFGTGLHSPVLMNGGFPVVNGFVTSFDSIEKVSLAKHGLPSILQACKVTGTCELFRDLFFGDDKKYVASSGTP